MYTSLARSSCNRCRIKVDHRPFSAYASSCHYRELGVRPNAAATEIKAAYLSLARRHHPDVSKEAGAGDRFRAIASAYEVLGNDTSRARYDASRAFASAFGRRPGHYTNAYTDSYARAASAERTRDWARRSGGRESHMTFLEAYISFMVVAVPMGLFYQVMVQTEDANKTDNEQLFPFCFNDRKGKWEEYNMQTMAGLRRARVRW
eukprot:CAMPEP_0113299844 /NCGR_PEP_ID=MMETSP0010_2-20120614/1715_1 /TAXON_ID=216773 ORGANISM="Corethron hystrix, Strain 308" /NCGR_SAMPLE_ID=MMETSP0010_2 /ASSEMBLY_ACC=CAM_ASM_000155 /LENGTH=204 /DNA_ID=CAMNT_0000153157 /DNA_START=404 /DNA_END=1015 /DNA_ORIENTATION=+ /assembly_acc=CAM_ASM_000155